MASPPLTRHAGKPKQLRAHMPVEKNPSKKKLVLSLRQEKGLQRAGEQEVREIQAEIRRRLGLDKAPSLTYISSILREAGVPVDYRDRFADPPMREPYATQLQGILQFHDLASAEESLRRLDAVYRQYREAADREGTMLVRALVLKGKQRAASLGSSPRVRPGKRQEKQEIARWFRVWLETPDLFFDWLEVRKQSEEFQILFPELSSQSAASRDTHQT